jgi:hypothetical protein
MRIERSWNIRLAGGNATARRYLEDLIERGIAITGLHPATSEPQNICDCQTLSLMLSA